MYQICLDEQELFKNAMNKDTHTLMASLINKAQDDKNIKAILIHGGAFFGSGNDIAALASAGGDVTPSTASAVCPGSIGLNSGEDGEDPPLQLLSEHLG